MTEHELYKNLSNDIYTNKQQILENVLSEQSVLNKESKGRFIMKKRFLAAACAALVAVSGITVYALSRFLTPLQTSEMLNKPFVAEAFKSEDATIVNESKADGKYMISFLGIANGQDFEIDNAQKDKTYAVIAISNTDGTAMTNSLTENFFVSPLINGLNPGLYNIATLNGAFTEKLVDGILYRLIECDNVQMFASRELYLCVNDGTFYNSQGFIYDEASGKITVNDSYNGVNVLFNLPISKEKADEGKVQEFINSTEAKKDDPSTDSEADSLHNSTEYILDNGLLDLTALKEKATIIEGSLATVTPDSNSTIYYSYFDDELGGGSGNYILQQKYAAGESFLMFKTVSEKETEKTISYATGTMLENGNIEFAVYCITEPIK